MFIGILIGIPGIPDMGGALGAAPPPAEVGMKDTAGRFLLDTAGRYMLDTTGA